MQRISKKDLFIAIKNYEKSFTKIHRVRDKDGEIRWVFNRTIFLKDDFGNITHLYGYINDITIMKLHEEELTQKIADEVAKILKKIGFQFIKVNQQQWVKCQEVLLTNGDNL